ncbi:MAG TPA: hypothetical protein VNV17_07505 [Solirubrobacteraceae bacterium]|jgi:hypothetical protein|nr:hypothetical protein [Solirubrobacteraceae bacterium]
MKLSGVAGIAVTALIGIAVTLPALADAHTQPVKNGFYSSLTGVPSTDVEFHVRSGHTIPNLSLGCQPADPSLTGTLSGRCVRALGECFECVGDLRR